MRWISALSGLIAASAAVLVMASLSEAPVEVEPSQIAEAQTPIVETPTTAGPTTVVIAEPHPDVSVSGLDESVSSALIVSGYTEFLDRTDLGSQLDPTVSRALTDEGAVLVIADESVMPADEDGEG